MDSNHKVNTNAKQYDHNGLNTLQVDISRRGDDLVVRVQCNQTNEILELIPSSKLRRDLPPDLVDGHVHWLNLSTKIIEIRPLEQLWAQSSENWRIDCASGQYRMYKGRETLVDIRSPTWAMVSACFSCFDLDASRERWDSRYPPEKYMDHQSRNLLITTSPTDSVPSASMQRLSVTLPCYGLSFFVNEKEELESRDFKDMVYDEDQCVGALLGLQTLVLRPKSHIAGALVPEAFIPRRVLIPNGFPKTYGNNQAWIDIPALLHTQSGEPLYRTYDVDTELGCLIGNGNIKNTRFLAYVHAVTSCHRPDLLTGTTGAQAALSLLKSAGCLSIMKLKALDYGDDWTSTEYPQINAAYQETLNRYYWDGRSSYSLAQDSPVARRAAYLFPSNATVTGPTSLSDRNHDERNYFAAHVPVEPRLPTLPRPVPERTPWPITLDPLFSNRPAPQLPPPSTFHRNCHKISLHGFPALDQLFSSLRTDSSFQRKYIARLDASAQHARVESQMTHGVAGENLIEALKKHYVECRVKYLNSLAILKKSLGPTTDPLEQALDRFGQWPPITANILLRYLASTSPIDIPLHWKKCLISLALLLLELQRSRRLLRFALDGFEEEFSKELENEGCDGWNAEEYPDWLLIQVDFFCPNARLYLIPLLVFVRFKETFSFVALRQKLRWKSCLHNRVKIL